MNIKIKIFFLMLVSISMSCLASDCEIKAHQIGSGKGMDQLDSNCLSYFKGNTEDKMKMEIRSHKIMVHKNVILIETPSKKNQLIAGPSTGLADSVAVSEGLAEDELIVLDSNGKVMTFNTTQFGNIGPVRLYQNEAFKGARNIFLQKQSEEIIVFNQMSQKVFFFSVKADLRSKKFKSISKVKKVLSGVVSLKKNNQDGKIDFINEDGESIK